LERLEKMRKAGGTIEFVDGSHRQVLEGGVGTVVREKLFRISMGKALRDMGPRLGGGRNLVRGYELNG